jgi:hypothetical protein
MSRVSYNKGKEAHYYRCPYTRKQRDKTYRFLADQCPLGAPCHPENKGGYGLYVPSTENLRQFPEIPRNSKRFKQLYAERTGVERSHAVEDSYHLDRCTRHAPYALVRLTLVNCAKHARLRWLERTNTESEHTLFCQTRDRILHRPDTVQPPE